MLELNRSLTEEINRFLTANNVESIEFPEKTGLIIVLVGFLIILCNLVYNFTCNKFKHYQSIPKMRFYWLKLVVINTQNTFGQTFIIWFIFCAI